MHDERPDLAPTGETHEQQLTRQMAELLQETRVSAVGVQVLFGFLLIVPFSGDLAEAPDLQRAAWLVAVLGAVTATALLLTPAILHRALLHRGQRPWVVAVGSRMLLLGAGATAVTLVASVLLAGAAVFDGVVVIAVPVVVALVLGGTWAVLPLLRARRVPGRGDAARGTRRAAGPR